MRRALLLASLFAAGARGQTMLDQEQRLIELHSLLIAIPLANAPGAYGALQPSVGAELIGIPSIDGQTGGKRQITASDRTPVFPRLRVSLGLPAPDGYRASVGLAYIPPLQINSVSSHLGALEAQLARALGPLWLGLRGQAVIARSQSPVTDPNTRDTLDTVIYGGDLSVGAPIALPTGSLTPYLAVGLLRVSGDFTVESDAYTLKSRTTDAALEAGLRFALPGRLEAAAEIVAHPGRLVHPVLRLAWTP